MFTKINRGRCHCGAIFWRTTEINSYTELQPELQTCLTQEKVIILRVLSTHSKWDFHSSDIFFPFDTNGFWFIQIFCCCIFSFFFQIKPAWIFESFLIFHCSLLATLSLWQHHNENENKWKNAPSTHNLNANWSVKHNICIGITHTLRNFLHSQRNRKQSWFSYDFQRVSVFI